MKEGRRGAGSDFRAGEESLRIELCLQFVTLIAEVDVSQKNPQRFTIITAKTCFFYCVLHRVCDKFFISSL